MDRLYILTGFLWLIAGMIFGIYLGITDQMQFSNTHAHINLLGFVLSALFGLLHRNWHAMMASRLALPQFALFQIGSLVLVAAKYDLDGGGGGMLAPPGSVLVVLGTLLMVWMFASATAPVGVAPKEAA